MNHKLSLEVTDTLNLQILRISDSSVYNSNVPVECPLLEITTPGFVIPVQFNETQIQPGFRSLNLTTCDLDLQIEDCGSAYRNLSDGIYIIKYSVSPGSIVYVEYNHLRTSNIMNNYLKVLCEIPLTDSEPNVEVSRKLDLLREIKMYIDAAKAQVEIAHQPQKGMVLYTYAKKLLNKFDCKTC
jgi:hypothetical protein